MDGKPLKISELPVSDSRKAMLGYLGSARTIAEVCAKFNKSYAWVSQENAIMRARGWIVRAESMSAMKRWKLDPKEVVP